MVLMIKMIMIIIILIMLTMMINTLFTGRHGLEWQLLCLLWSNSHQVENNDDNHNHHHDNDVIKIILKV